MRAIKCLRFKAVVFLVVTAAGCTTDAVGAGYYAEPGDRADTIAATQAGTGGQGGIGGGTAGTLAGQGGAGGIVPMAGAGMPAGSGGMDAGGASGAMAGAGGAGEGGTVAPPPCDMSGRWLVTHHHVAEALGQLQTGHVWAYYELTQTGETITATRALHCGDDTVPVSLLGGNVKMEGSWPGSMMHNDYTGDIGTSRPTAEGCELTFHAFQSVLGATVETYRDTSVPLPTLEQPAAMGMPGWEDWENDGHPGVTLSVDGLVTGDRYGSLRIQHTPAVTTVPEIASLIKVSERWKQEESVYGATNELLIQEGVATTDPTMNFFEMARLDEAQAVGDDAATCQAVRDLRMTLTPTAAGM